MSPSIAPTSAARSTQIKKDGVKFDVRKVPARPLQQVFVHDPDGVMIELNFWNEEDVPELADTAPMDTKAKPKAPGEGKAARYRLTSRSRVSSSATRWPRALRSKRPAGGHARRGDARDTPATAAVSPPVLSAT